MLKGYFANLTAILLSVALSASEAELKKRALPKDV